MAKKGKLTPLQVQAAINKGEARDYCDGLGLYLCVVSSSSASWKYRFQIDGKRRNLGLGSALVVTLAQARQLAQEAREKVSQGDNPISASKAARAKLKAEQDAPRFKQVALDHIDAKAKEWRGRSTEKDWRGTMATYVFPVIGDLKPVDVTPDHIAAITVPLIEAGKLDTADRLLKRISAVITRAKAGQLMPRNAPNPTDRALLKYMGAAPVLERDEMEAPPIEDMPKVIEQLLAIGGYPELATVVLALTGTRSKEVQLMRWDELDLERGEWHLRDTRTKTGFARTVYLSRLAVDTIKRAKPIAGSPFVFTGAHGKAMHHSAMRQALKKVSSTGTPHGFRTNLSDWATDNTSVDFEFIRACIGRRIAGVDGRYFRKHAPRKQRAVFEAWASYCSGSDEHGKVIHLHPANG